MPRFTNTLTGSVVNVPEATAAQLGSEWTPTGQAVPAEPSEDTQEPKRRARPRKTN